MTTRTTYEIQYKFKSEGDGAWEWGAGHKEFSEALGHLRLLIARNEPEYDYRIVRVDTTRTPMGSGKEIKRLRYEVQIKHQGHEDWEIYSIEESALAAIEKEKRLNELSGPECEFRSMARSLPMEG